MLGPGVFGLAACYVGQGEVTVKTKKLYDPSRQKSVSEAELESVIYALNELSTILEKRMIKPEEVYLFSDQDRLSHFMTLESISDEEKELKNIKLAQHEYERMYPDTPLHIDYISKKDRKFNPFFAAAHNRFRNVLKPRR